MALHTSEITSAGNGDISLNPNGTGKVKLNKLAGNGELPIGVANANGEVRPFDHRQLTELSAVDPDDLLLVQREDSYFTVDASTLGGSSLGDPLPGNISWVPYTPPGSGTQSDPWRLAPITVDTPGGVGTSAETMIVSGMKPNIVIPIKDVSERPALGRFEQQWLTCDSNGSTQTQFVYKDAPNSDQPTTYAGAIKVGATTVWITWDVTQRTNRTQFFPAPAPTASPTTVDYAADGKYGTVSGIWADGDQTLNATELVFSVNDGALDNTPKRITNSDKITVGFVDATVAAAAEGDTITGLLYSADNSYLNEFVMVKDVTPAAFTLPSAVDQALSTEAGVSFGAIRGINAPTTIAAAGTSGNALTDVKVSVNGGTPAPASGTFNPGDTLEGYGTTGSSASTTYQATFTLGGVDGTWDVTTTSTAPTIAQPSIISPLSGSADLVPDVTLVGSTYSALNGAGAHASSDWEVYETDMGTLTSGVITGITESDLNDDWTYVPITTIRTDEQSQGPAVGLDGVGYVGDYDTSYKTTDGGVTWRSNKDCNNGDAGFYATDGTGRWIAIGKDNVAWYSTNNGGTWAQGATFPVSYLQIRSIVMKPNSTYVGVVGGGTVEPFARFSSDLGASWSGDRSNISGTDAIEDICYDASLDYFVWFGRSGRSVSMLPHAKYYAMSATTNGWSVTGSVSWVANIGGGLTANRYKSIASDGNGNIMIAGSPTGDYDARTFYGSITGADGGMLPNPPRPTTINADVVYWPEMSMWVATAAGNQLAYSTDNGQSWTTFVPIPSITNNWYSIVINNSYLYATAYAAGSGVVAFTEALGLTTTLQLADGTNLTQFSGGDDVVQDSGGAPETSAITNVDTSTPDQVSLTLTNSTNLANFKVGDAVTETGGDGTGTVSSVGATSLVLTSPTGTWDNGSTVTGPTFTPATGRVYSVNTSASTIVLTGSDQSGTKRWLVTESGYETLKKLNKKVSNPMIPAPPGAPTTEPPSAAFTPVTPSTETLTSATLDDTNLNPNKAYYSRVKYSDGSISSQFSAYNEFVTKASFVPEPGEALAGGYFAGQIRVFAGEDDGVNPTETTIYNLYACPIEKNGLYGQHPVGLRWRTNPDGAAPDVFNNQVYGVPALIDATSNYEALYWVKNGIDGPNGGGGYDATNTAKTGINGYNDWYLPARYEQMIVYFTLKPTTDDNSPNDSTGTRGNGENPNAVLPYPPNADWTPSFPAQTPNLLFQSGGSEQYLLGFYWSSSQDETETAAYRLQFQDGAQGRGSKSGTAGVRAIRREPA